MPVNESATIDDQLQRPQRVSIWGRDSNGVLRAIGVGTDGQITLNLTGEGLALDVSVDTLEAKLAGPTTGTKSNVNDAASSTTVLASNANRKGATFFNDSTVSLYLDLSGGTATTTSFSVLIPAQGYFELPVCQGGVYTGLITGIWASDASGAVRVTEFA
jgi:hypothetical protein